MTEETKKLFIAPWYVDIHAVDGIDGETYVFDGVYNDKCELVCGNIQKHVTSNRITHLPELYEALREAVDDACGTCAMMQVDSNSYDFVKNGCPFFEDHDDCLPIKWIDILRKVRNGE